MTKENIKRTLSFLKKKSVFCQIFRKKICILPKSMGKKSVYTDKISMSGRSAYLINECLIWSLKSTKEFRSEKTWSLNKKPTKIKLVIPLHIYQTENHQVLSCCWH